MTSLFRTKIIPLTYLFIMCFFINVSCSPKIITVKIKAFEKATNKPLADIDVYVYTIKDPIFSRRQFNELYKTKTNSNGIFTFKVHKKGGYSIRYYDKNGKPLFWTDTLKIKDLDSDKFFNFKL